VVKLKKQTQFAAGRNGRKVNYNKGMREICWIGHLVKTNPIQSQSRLAPSTAGSLKGYLKKQTVRQGKLVQFSRFESYPAKVSRPAGM